MQATLDDTDDAGSWMDCPDAAHAAAYATPFPDFDGRGDSQVGAAVYDLNLAHMVRVTEQEAQA